MLPFDEGHSSVLTGNNISYKRQKLPGLESLKSEGFWKTFANRQLLSSGHQLWTDPHLTVTLQKELGFSEFFCSRYHHGRCFAGMRVSDSSRLKAAAFATMVPLLPALMMIRQFKSVWPKARNRKRFFMTVPLLLLFNANWAWGELFGYLRGPGRSCSQLFY